MKDYPVIKLAIGISLGIIFHSYITLDLTITISIILSLLVVIYSLYRIDKKRFDLIIQFLLILLFTCVGIIISSLNKETYSTRLDKFHKEKNTIAYGEVESIDLKKVYEISFTLKTDSIRINDSTIHTSEKLLCRLRSGSKDRKIFYDNINPGNKISFSGTFIQARSVRNPGEFDYKKYLLSKGITGIITSYQDSSFKILNRETNFYTNLIFNIRKYLDEVIHKTHNKQTAGLLRGLLLADRSEIDNETKLNFINAGVIHILAVSGLHVGYILLFFFVIFGRFNLYLKSIFVIAGIFCFMLITGVPASVFRATLMASIIIIAFLTNRSTNLVNSIALSSVIILLIQPQQIFNPGFQLSYSAVLSIALIYPILQKEIQQMKIKNEIVKKILLFIGVSFSAQIGTLPFTVAYFNKISVIALLANLFVIPLAALIVGLGIITILIGSISYAFASFFGITNNFFTALMFKVVEVTGNYEYSHIKISDYSILDGLIFYSFLALFIYGMNRIYKPAIKILFSIFIFSNIYVFSLLDDKELLENGKLNVLMIDVDQGDSFLIKFPEGKTALIDAGKSDPFFDVGERVIIPLLDYLGIKKIDYGFISHFDNDHYGGFYSLLVNQRIKEVFIPEPDSSSKSIKFNKFLDELKIPKRIYHKEKLMVDNSAIYILNDTTEKYFDRLSSNDRSGVKKIVFGETSFLFLGDVEIPAERYYTQFESKMLDADVLKVGHHGSKTGSSEEFLNAVSPKISLISAGIKNKFGHPSEIVLERLQKMNSKILRTDSAGAVLLQSDGKEIKVVDWRNF
ncbi:MAG: DNA internalization-related competence protein ComEC/Rec2 [Ignavibacterium sp.]|nr:DNA internalization-related competence protein ComEC/Rec2 [Ignavibacterium sp.]